VLMNKKVAATVGVMAGLPSNLWEFTWSLANLVDFSNQYVCGPGQSLKLIRSSHAFHTLARNDLAKQAEGEFVLMLDTDHQFEPDLLFRLINAANKYEADVVASLYLMKTPPHRPTLWRFPGDRITQPLGAWPKDEAMEIDCAGAGGLLIKTSVFTRIWRELRQEPFDTHQFMQDGGGPVGEDFAFFRRCKMLGLRAITCPWIQCHHLQVKPLDANKDYDQGSVLQGAWERDAVHR
jgi:glycosyltransferase involved in cell wall biosynthesis